MNDAVRVISVERFGRDELLSRLKQTRLVGLDGAQPYERATLELRPATDPADLTPAQRYVLNPGVRGILALRQALLEHRIDLFALDGGVYIRTSDAPDTAIPLIPPIIERSSEPDGRVVWLINDGIHRVHAARISGLPIAVVTADGVPPEYPYYALALPGGWDEVVEFEELPDGFQKKEYRVPGNYKALFRDFNAVLPGVQKERKKSNPSHLTA
jgi:hypothetical protein